MNMTAVLKNGLGVSQRHAQALWMYVIPIGHTRV